MAEAMFEGQSYKETPKDPEWFTKGYRTLASFYHPDNQETGDAEKMRLINNAHDNKDKKTILNELKELKRILDQKENTKTFKKVKREETKPEWGVIKGEDREEKKVSEIHADDFSFVEMRAAKEKERQERLLKIETAVSDFIIANERRDSLQKQRDELDDLASSLGIKKNEQQIVADYDSAHDDYVKTLNELGLLTGKNKQQIEKEYLGVDSEQEKSLEEEKKAREMQEFLREQSKEVYAQVENLEGDKAGVFERFGALMRDRKFQVVAGMAIAGVAIIAPPVEFINMLVYGMKAGFLPVDYIAKATSLAGMVGGGLMMRGITSFSGELKSQGEEEIDLTNVSEKEI
jgi:hypothetical protein